MAHQLSVGAREEDHLVEVRVPWRVAAAGYENDSVRSVPYIEVVEGQKEIVSL